ncbi:hypothetical protein NEMIN01_0246 [Nematocida minor]|uniref:uncharacterized protein n=1 Tax=Nematocida minor TaxID=1912983 RepID=UPI00221FD9D0|nr:uncharacterized protein NEMIN01_0246 [Nematocida minor]KAI5188982.1 hypothetical protein NEMIN01_0246 [Nematocida minor]
MRTNLICWERNGKEMALQRMQQLCRIPVFILVVSECLTFGTLVWHWKMHNAECVQMAFYFIIYQLLELRCFLFRSLEYLLCMAAMSGIMVFLSASYGIPRNFEMRSLFYASLIRTVAYSLLVYYFSPIFKKNAYFVYAKRGDGECIFFEGALLKAFIEIQATSFIVYEFSKVFQTHAVFENVYSRQPCFAMCAMESSVKIAVYVETVCLATKNKVLYWGVFILWIFYVLHENFVYHLMPLYLRHNHLFMEFSEMHQLWEKYHLLNIAVAGVFFVYSFVCKRTYENIYIVREAQARIRVE